MHATFLHGDETKHTHDTYAYVRGGLQAVFPARTLRLQTRCSAMHALGETSTFSRVLSPHLPARFRYPGRRSERSRRVARATGHVSRGRLIGMRRKARENLISRDLLTRRTVVAVYVAFHRSNLLAHHVDFCSRYPSPRYGDRRRVNLRPRS